MTKLLLYIGLTTFIVIPSLAMQTENLPERTLKAFGKTLAESASSAQWQQLWTKMRSAGAFAADGDQPRFTLSLNIIPDHVRASFHNADRAWSKAGTMAVYRRDFAPRVVGTVNNEAVTNICVTVDWRSVPEGTSPLDYDAFTLASLHWAVPCK